MKIQSTIKPAKKLSFNEWIKFIYKKNEKKAIKAQWYYESEMENIIHKQLEAK